VRQDAAAGAGRTRVPRGRRLYNGGFARALLHVAREDGVARLWSSGFAGFEGRDCVYSAIRLGL